MTARVPRICECAECRRLDRVHPNEGQQLPLIPAGDAGPCKLNTRELRKP